MQCVGEWDTVFAILYSVPRGRRASLKAADLALYFPTTSAHKSTPFLVLPPFLAFFRASPVVPVVHLPFTPIPTTVD